MWARRLAWATIVAQLACLAGWLFAGVIEHHGYSVTSDDISDLGALTAHHPEIVLVTCGMSGAVTIAFALVALRPALGIGAWLVALSLAGLDDLSDAFFRLDCRAADHGCSIGAATASWHGKIHLAAAVVAAIATVLAPFVLARRMRRSVDWRELARPTEVFGIVVALCTFVSVALTDSSAQGIAQRVLAVIVPLGVVALAVRVLQLKVVDAPRGSPMSNAFSVNETRT
ncbi:MAG TPA: DUF998 domain-containing protein [Acidimicrobiales bacterium]|nr:DUF998 domain-containing protein [Acidimicrobiales bacterium]